MFTIPTDSVQYTYAVASLHKHKPAQYPTPHIFIFIYYAWLHCDTNGENDYSS